MKLSPLLQLQSATWVLAASSGSEIATAFSISSLANRHGPSHSRSSNVIPALPCQFGHDRLTTWPPSPIGCIGSCTTSARRFGTRDKPNSSRSTCTRIYANQELKEDVDVDFDQAIALAQLSEDGNTEETQIVVDDATINNIADGKSPDLAVESTGIPPEFIPILSLCFLVTLLSALDRVAMSIAILPLSAEFGYTETIKGQISSAVSYGYGLAIVPIGLAVSVVSSRLLMFVGVGLWSLATLGTPWVAVLSGGGGRGMGEAASVALLPLLLARATMGAAEAVVLPTMQRLLANWIPPERKATALAIVISGFQFGTVSAYLVSPWVLDVMSGLDGGPAGVLGWRGMFYVYGLAGLAWMVPWWLVAKDAPSAGKGEAEADCEETLVNTMIEDDASLVLNECDVDFSPDAPPATKLLEVQTLIRSAPWRDFASSPGVWAMTLAHAAKNWELYNLLAWTPTFFSEQYGLNVKESALFSVVPSLCGMVGGLTAGNAADYVLSLELGDGNGDDGDNNQEAMVEKRTRVRKLFQSIALLGPAASLYLLSGLPDHATTAQILLGGAVGLQAFDAAGFGAATQEKAGERWAGLLYSITSLPGVMVGSASVSVTGRLLDQMADAEGSGWATVFRLNAAVCVAGALAFLLFYDSKKEFE